MIIFIILLLIPSVSFAYLDPGTGSMILQIIIAGIAGIVFFIKTNWKKIRGIKDSVSEDEQESKVEMNDSSNDDNKKAS